MSKPPITVFEHEVLKIGIKGFKDTHLEALQKFHGDKGVPYYTLVNKGVKFTQYVGVLQVGDLTIEVLPKADKSENKDQWRVLLIDMLRSVGVFNVHAPSSSNLRLKNNSILDFYFELFLKEVEYLVRTGLVKKYKKTEANLGALKGKILFPKHIQHNLIHKESFYVKYTKYTYDHIFHSILYKALEIVKNNSINSTQAKTKQLLLGFPEVKNIKIDTSTFERLHFDRKTSPYKNAIDIARLIILNYHPDLVSGKNNVLALMFDMNLLWEKFVYKTIRNGLDEGYIVTQQNLLNFWKSPIQTKTTLKADILIHNDDINYVLDTKWKAFDSKRIGPDDLRQMYSYIHYYNASKVCLVYPGEGDFERGYYFDEENNSTRGKNECSVIPVNSFKNLGSLKEGIVESVVLWLDND